MALGGLAAGGCAPRIGDACTQSVDCATNGTRECDTSQPNGYCTIVNCSDDSCPDDAACILFQPAVPGCVYDDYQAPSRISRAFCLKTCGDDSDCRQSEGYVCADPKAAPWFAIDLDNNQSERVCIVTPLEVPDAGATAPSDAAVCSPPPNMSFADAEAGDAGEATGDASQADARPPGDAGGPDAGTDAGLDAGAGPGFDAGDHDAGLDAGAQSDAASDAAGAGDSGGD